MSNSTASNPIIIDSTGVVTENKTLIKGILVNASGATWAVVLKDSVSGNIIFQWSQNITGDTSKYIPVGVWVRGIYATTLTSITNILVYTDGVP